MIENLPTPQHLSEWRRVGGYADEKWPLSRLQEVQFRGNERVLYPTQPQQGTKTYHRYDYAMYNTRELSATDDACALHQFSRLTAAQQRERLARAKERGRRVRCIQGDKAYDLVFSATYYDDQRNLYRGVARQVFLATHESMGHSVALGHTFYPKPNSQFANEMFDGDTYPVAVDDFILLARPFPTDAEQVRELQRRAERTHRRDGLLWRHNGVY